MVVRANCEGVECDNCFPSQPLVVLTIDQFVGHDGGLLNNRSRIATFIKNWHFASDFCALN